MTIFEPVSLDELNRLQVFNFAGEKQDTKIQVEAFLYQDYKQLKPMQWVYGSFLQRGTVASLIGAAGQGKSMISIGMGLCLAFGKNFYSEKVHRKSKVWFFNGEDSKDNIQRRIHAFCKKHEIDPKNLDGQLYINSGLESGLKLAWTETGSKILENENEIQNIISQLKEKEIDVAIFDPFISFHKLNENDNNAIDLVVKMFAKVAVEANCAILLVHHSGKAKGEAIGSEGARGASSFIGAVRSARVLNNLTKAEIEKFNINEAEVTSYVSMSDVKANFSAKSPKKQYYKLESEFFENANDEKESIGVSVVQNFDLFDLFEDTISNEQWDEIRERLISGKWRYEATASNWIGNEIADFMNIDLSSASEKKRIKNIINELIKNGRLEKYIDKTAQRKLVEFIRPIDALSEI